MIRDDVLHDPRAMYQMAQQAPFCLKTSGDSAEQEDNCYRSHFASNRSREDLRGTKKDAPRGVPNDRYYNLAQRSHLAISVQRRDSPRHQSPVFIITAQWRRHFTVGIHDPLQRRRPPTAQTGLLGVGVPSQTAIGANHPSTALPLQVWERRGERDLVR